MTKKSALFILFTCLCITFPLSTNAQEINVDKSELNSSVYPELDNYLNSRDYSSIRSDSVYVPVMSELELSDPRIAHLLDANGYPINPLLNNQSDEKFKDGGPQYSLQNIVPQQIDFVEIQGKVYYRMVVEESSLAQMIPSELIDYENYPGFILLEILSDINAIANEYLRNGADSVVMLNNNSFRVYKLYENLNTAISFEANQIGRKDYPGFFTYARLENALYLPLKNKYPSDSKEELSKRTTNSRHFMLEDGSIEASLTMRPTSYPILPKSGDYKLENMSSEQRSKIKWIELPSCYPIPAMSATKATYTTYFDETFYGHSVYCTADEPSPYVWICSPADGNYLSTVGALSDDDALSAEEYNYNRIHEKFDITSIPDCATVNSAQFENYLPDIPPYVTGDCDGTISWEEVWPETKEMYQNMTSANNTYTDGSVDTYSYTWYNDVEDGLVYFIDNTWDWDRADLYTGWDVDFNTLGLDDIESQLASNWYVVGVADEDENNQSPTYWEAVANYGYYANFRINYTTHPNDLCTEAVVLSSFPYSSGVVSNSCAQTETIPTTSCISGTTGATVWYQFTGTGNRMELSTDYAGTSLDTEIHLLSGSCGALTEVACDDDGGVLGLSSELYFCSTLGTTYYVTVGHFSGLTYGNYEFSVIDFPVGDPTAVSASPTTICNGNSSTLYGTPGTNGEQVHWYTGSCGGTYVGAGTSLAVNPTTTTTYYARTFDTDCSIYSPGCVSVTVTVDQLPVATAGGTQTICVTATGTVSGATASNGTINWTENGAGSITLGGTTLTPTYTPAPADAGNIVTLTMTVTSNNVCTPQTATASYTFTITPAPSNDNCSNAVAIGGLPYSSGVLSTQCAGSDNIGTDCANGNNVWYVVTGTGNLMEANTVNGSTIGFDTEIEVFTGSCGALTEVSCDDDGGSNLQSLTQWCSTLGTTYYISVGYYYDAGVYGNYLLNVLDYPIGIPTAISATPSTICSGNSSTISATPGTYAEQIHWYTSSCGGSYVGTGNSILVNPATTTTYYARSFDTDCSVYSSACTDVTVTVNTNASITSATAAASPICPSATTTVTANGVAGTGAVLTWFTGTGGTGTNLGSTNPLTVGPGTYYARVTGDCGGPVEASVTVASKVNVAITSATAAASPICSSATTTITANGVTGTNAVLTWFTGTGGTGTNLGSASPLTIGPGTYYARVTGDCGGPVEASVTVASNTNVSITSATATASPICSSTTTTITANGVTGTNAVLTWFTGTGGTGTNLGSANPLTVGPGTYYARVTGDCGGPVETSVAVASDPLPTATAGGSQSICGTETAIVSGATAANGTISWTENGVGSITSGANTLTPEYTPAAGDNGNTVTLTLTVTSNNTCAPQTATANYTVNVGLLPIEPAFASSDRNNFCNDDAGNINLSVAGGSGTIVRWFDDACDGNDIGTGNPLNISSPSVNTTYYARWENTCGSSTCITTTVTVVAPPIAPISAQSDMDDFCADDAGNIQLSVIGGSGTTVQWFTGSCGGSSAGTGNPLIIPSPDVTTTYFARWENSCGTTTCVEVTVKVNPLPEAPVSAQSDNTSFCADDAGNIQLSVTGGSGDILRWFESACSGTEIGTGNPLIIESPTVNTTYFARWENGCGNSACATVTVTVLPLPEIMTNVLTTGNNLCVDDPGTIDLSVVGGSGTSLHWYTGSCGDTEIGTGNPLNIASPAVTTEYFVRWENSCGETPCQSIVINTINAPADPLTADVDINSVCVNDAGNITLTLNGGAGPVVEWYSETCGGTPVGTGNPLVIASPVVNTTYFGRYESSCGTSICQSVNVNVLQLPEPPVSAETDINNFCSNDDGVINLSLTGGSGTDVYWFTESCGGTPIGIGNPLEIESPESTTTYYGRWENSCGVTVCQNVTVTVIPAPDATITPAGPFCVTDDPVVILAAELGGSWTGTAIHPATGLFDPETAGAGNHLITYNISGVCPDEDQITITVLPLFDATITPVAPMCTGDGAITLSAVDAGGTWSGTGITDPIAGTFNPAIAGDGNHIITYENTGTCGSSDNITIDVTQSADATIDNPGTLCVTGDPIVITAAQIGGTWAGTAINPSTGFFDPEVAGVGEHVISYTITGSCGDDDAITITVIPLFDATIDPVSAMCFGDDPITLSAATLGGTWSGTGITDVNAGIFDPEVSGVGDHVITYENTDLCGSFDNITITVLPKADATITDAGPFCVNDDPILISAAQTGGTWSGTAIDPGTGFFDPEVAGIGDHTITYLIEGQCGDIDETIISVLSIFDATITAVDPMCSGDEQITLTAVTDGGVWSGTGITDADAGIFDPATAGAGNHVINYSYAGACGSSDDITITVSPSADASITPITPFCETDDPIVFTAAQIGGTWAGTAVNPSTGFFDPEVAGVGEHTISYTITGACGDLDEITVYVLPNFDATITSGADVCLGDEIVTLTAATNGGTWEGMGVNALTGEFNTSTAGEGTHQIIYTNSGLCGDADTAYITVHPNMDATITPVDSLYEDDEPVILIAANTGGIWYGTGIDATGTFDPELSGIGEFEVIYTISGTCGDSDTTVIKVLEIPIADLKVPTAITPDGDGYNDRWKIQGVEAYYSVSIRIFTRWGDEVYSFDGTGYQYSDPSNQWDGKRKDNELPSGSYVFILILNGEDTHKGTISLIR